MAEPRDKQINVYLTAGELRAVDRLCEQTNRGRGNLIRTILGAYVRGYQPEQLGLPSPGDVPEILLSAPVVVAEGEG